MKILLANPPGPWLRCRWDIRIENENRYYPYPVRLAYATSVLKKNNYDAYIIDATTEEIDEEEFISRFEEINPDVLIWETVASSFDVDINLMKRLRKINPKIKIGVSGYHTSAVPGECIDSGYDFVVIGECEYSILEMVKWLDNKIKKFPEGIYMKSKKYVPRPLIKNINELPWPERGSLPIKKYNDPKLKGFNVVLVSSRGCPRGCSFCTVAVYYGKPSYRFRDSKDVVDEMKFLWDKYKPDELYFDDDNFALNKKHVIDICNEISNRKLKIKWNCMVDASLDKGLLKVMKKSGCTGITIGAESADDEVLKHLGKTITRKIILETVKICKEIGLRSHICWVLGLPHSSKKSDIETVEFALNMPSDTLQFSICTPYLGTKMYKWCEDNGYLRTKEWKNFSGQNSTPVIDLPGYSYTNSQGQGGGWCACGQ